MNYIFFKSYSPYDNILSKNRLAAVLIPIVDFEGEDHILFQTRSLNLKTQPGEVSFPGGKIEKGENPADAAIRETVEELGCKEKDIELIGPSDYYIATNGVIIHPYVGKLKYYDEYPIDEEEVGEVFLVPLKFFLENEPEVYKNISQVKPDENFPYEYIEKYLHNGKNYKFFRGEYEIHFYIYKNRLIWGMTAAILKNFIDILKGDFQK